MKRNNGQAALNLQKVNKILNLKGPVPIPFLTENTLCKKNPLAS